MPSINTFTVGTDSYLVVTQKISNPGGKIQLHIYKWNGTLFVLHQTIDGLDSTLMDLKHTPEIFGYNGKTYMLVMGLDDGYSKLYEWSTNGTFDFVQIINGFYASIHSDFFSVDEKNMILGYDFLQKQYKYYQWTPIPYANIVNPTDGTIAIPQTWDASTTPITGSGTP